MDRQKLFATLLGAGAAMAAACLLGTQVEQAGAQSSAGLFAYVGSYTTVQRKARGDGIHAFRVDPVSGTWTHVQHVGELTNPSFSRVEPRSALSLLGAWR